MLMMAPVILALCVSVQFCSSTTWLTHVLWMLYAQSLYHTLEIIYIINFLRPVSVIC